MRIRGQLALMMSAVVAPVAVLALLSLGALTQLQRDFESQRILERVNALRLALDTEIAGTMRVLKTLSDLPAANGMIDPTALPDLPARLGRVLGTNPMWSAVVVLSPDGTPLAQQPPALPAARPLVDSTTLQALRERREPVVSDLQPGVGGASGTTTVAVPLLREGSLRGFAAVVIDQRAWLGFLRNHVISTGATLTLNDRTGIIVARTLNHDQWAGKPSSPGYWQRTIGRNEGTLTNTGLEGQRFYSAFSRLRTAGWVLGSGVPAEEVEQALAVPASLTVLGVVLAAATAGLLAVLLGRRISLALHRLSTDASDAASGLTLPASEPLALEEAEEVRRLMRDTLRNESRARAEAERASRAKDEFLAMLAHELRNPLSAMRSAIALLDIGTAAPDVEKRAREVLARQTGHMTALINEMLDAARLATGKITLDRRPMDLTEAVRHVVQNFEDSGRTRHLRMITRLEPAPVLGDETRLEQVAANLLDNAAKYGAAGGEVQVEVGREGAEAVLTVTDRGGGIGPDLLPHIFEPFSQAERTIDRSQGGLGLGLTVVRGLVEQHGGRVQAFSEGPGQGARFVVRLPLAQQDAASANPDLAGHAPPSTRRRILLVEDNQDNREMVSTLLRTAGHEVSTAADGEQGISAAGARPPQIALIDLGLPGTDGLAVARALRALPALQHTLLVALTGYGDPATRRRAEDAGFDAFLQKPFDLTAFEQAVSRHGGDRPAAPGEPGSRG
jgi:signal transduction histidine kinase/CheY-like chemotaxis protein